MRIRHPHSGITTTVESWHDYKANLQKNERAYIPVDNEPWRPFASRIDFEFAEFTANAHLSRPQVDDLLKIVHRIASGGSGFTLQSYTDLDNVWEKASHIHTPVRTVS